MINDGISSSGRNPMQESALYHGRQSSPCDTAAMFGIDKSEEHADKHFRKRWRGNIDSEHAFLLAAQEKLVQCLIPTRFGPKIL